MKFLIVIALALASTAALPKNRHEGRIVGGENADIINFNYQVGLSLEKGPFDSFWCGGSLIASEWILTAAHCMEDTNKITVYLGDTKRARAEFEVEIVRNANNVIVHEGFIKKTMLNDIALIRIPPVKYSDKIRPIRLNKISCNDGTFPGDFATAAGSDNIRARPNNLQITDCNDGTFPGDFDTASDSDILEDTASDDLTRLLKTNCNDGTFPGDFDTASDSVRLEDNARGIPTKVQRSSCNDGTFPGDFATASGWGQLGDYAWGPPSTLQSVTLRIISNDECTRTFGKAVITNGNICLSTRDGGVMRSTCDGDSGGPLVMKGTNLQIGLTSFGAKNGCELGHPVAFTRISSFIDWIVAKTGITV